MELIDFHSHLHPTEEALIELLYRMDKVGISQSVVVAGGVVSPAQLSKQIGSGGGESYLVPNRQILKLCNQSEKRLVPFYFANPHQDSSEYQVLGELFSGLKMGPAVHGIALTDRRYELFLDLAIRFKHPVYLHCLPRSGFDIAALIFIAEKFPELTFILGHAGIGNCDFMAVDLINTYPNIYFETSGGFSSVVKYAIKKLGPDRILFGSEYPLQDPEIEIEKMRCIGFKSEDLNRNARRLVGRLN